MANAVRTLDHAAVKLILDERARILAIPVTIGEPDQTMVLAVLLLGRERFGIDIRFVREIRRLETVTPLPGTPAFWIGLGNVRGRLLPVLDLARFMALPVAEVGSDRVVVIVEAANLEVALSVDGMPEVRRLRQDELGPPASDAAEFRRSIVLGVTSDLLTVLNVPALLADPKLVVHAT